MENIFLTDAKFYLEEPDAKKTFRDADKWYSAFDDSSWRTVKVPHDWAVDYPFDINNSSGTAYLTGGTAWYRFHFTLKDFNETKRARINFGGIYKHAKVWCNSYYLGNHQNGYTSFSFDMTHALRTDGSENIIAVQVNHNDFADSRWYAGSGIQREICIELTDSARFTVGGIHFTNSKNSFTVETEYENNRDSDLSLTARLKDAEDKIIWEEKSQNKNTQKTVGLTFSATLSPDKINFWCPENPYLYTLETQIEANGKISDSKKTKVGFTDYCFDADKGFFCNGTNVKLKGLCVHEDAGCLGNAVPKEVWKRRLEKFKEMGCNAIRMSHNPHSKNLYELCDEMGFFVMDEIYDEWANPKNKWVSGHNVYPPSHQGITDDFYSCYEQDVKSFVCANRNRPSVIMWSIGNEIDYPNDPYCSPKFKEMTGNNDASKPKAERMYNPAHPDIKELPIIAQMLSNEVKKYDTVRPVTMALAFPELSETPELYKCLDVVGFNYKEQFYEENHKKYPAKPFIGSENSHSPSAWKYVAENEYISGQFLWTGIDYLGEAMGWPLHGAQSGRLDAAGFEKPNFYLTKSLWVSKETETFAKVFTCMKGNKKWNRLWNFAENSEVELQIYSNLENTEIFINSKKICCCKKNDEGIMTCTVNFEFGKLEIIGNGKVLDSIESSGAATKLCTNLINGETVAQIEIFAEDSEGIRVCSAEHLVKIECEGCELMGIENGNVADNMEYSVPYRRMFNGQLIAYIRKTSASGTARICCENFETCQVKI